MITSLNCLLRCVDNPNTHVIRVRVCYVYVGRCAAILLGGLRDRLEERQGTHPPYSPLRTFICPYLTQSLYLFAPGSNAEN